MIRSRTTIGILLAAWLSTGLFVVRANEKAVVRRFGRVVTTREGAPRLLGSGLHVDVPWPLKSVDRVNFNAVRTLTVGGAELSGIDLDGFLQSGEAGTQSQFLTGDRNILNLQITAQFHAGQDRVVDYLFRSEAPVRRLGLLLESATADLIAQSGVDFIHPLGLRELQARLTGRLRRLAIEQNTGFEIDAVTIDAVYPPTRVKADFLDVANARNDREKQIQTALAYQQLKQAQAGGESRRIEDEAESRRESAVEAARAQADRFRGIIRQFVLSGPRGSTAWAGSRQLAMQRMYLDSMEQILRDVGGKVFLESGRPVDLTIFRESGQ